MGMMQHDDLALAWPSSPIPDQDAASYVAALMGNVFIFVADFTAFHYVKSRMGLLISLCSTLFRGGEV
jgi:hypothetical protein